MDATKGREITKEQLKERKDYTKLRKSYLNLEKQKIFLKNFEIHQMCRSQSPQRS